MFTVLVSLKVKPEHVAAFKEATLADSRASLQDPGVHRLDVLQQNENPNHFTLHEVFDSREVGLQHLQMAHFKEWQAAIKPWLVEPPHAVVHTRISP